MFTGNKRLCEGSDLDLQRQYKKAIQKYTEGVEVILGELEKDKEKATEELLCKIDKYIERIKLLKSFLNNRDDGNPHAMLLPQQPTTTPKALQLPQHPTAPPIVRKTEEYRVANKENA